MLEYLVQRAGSGESFTYSVNINIFFPFTDSEFSRNPISCWCTYSRVAQEFFEYLREIKASGARVSMVFLVPAKIVLFTIGVLFFFLEK